MENACDRMTGTSVLAADSTLAGGMWAGWQADPLCPPVVTRGAESAGEGEQLVSVSLDWIRVTGPREYLAMVRDLLSGRFGTPTYKPKGLLFFGARLEWEGGAKVLFDPEELPKASGHLMVELSGHALSKLSGGERHLLLRDLLCLSGMKCRRLDIAIDYRRSGGGLDIVGDAIRSCARGEYCRARVWRPVVEYHVHRGLIGATCYIGKRGCLGSGRFVRIYDKGLEQKESGYGYWQRIEVEFGDEVAEEVGLDVAYPLESSEAADGLEEWESRAVEYVFGAVDFRVVNGRTCLSERPRCEWWAALMAGVKGKRVRVARRTPCLESQARFLRKQVLPGLKQAMKRTGWTVREVLSYIGASLEDVEVDDSILRPWVAELLEDLDKRGIEYGDASFWFGANVEPVFGGPMRDYCGREILCE